MDRLDPDKNPDPAATVRFQSVNKAHHVLSDEKLRSTYDLLGAQGADMVDQCQGKRHVIIERPTDERCLSTRLWRNDGKDVQVSEILLHFSLLLDGLLFWWLLLLLLRLLLLLQFLLQSLLRIEEETQQCNESIGQCALP